MEAVDLNYLCTTIGNLSGIPIRIYEGEKQTFFYSVVRLPKDPMALYRKELWEIEDHVGYYSTPNFSYYGLVNHGTTKIVIGPTRQLPESEQELRELGFQLELSGEETRNFKNAMRAIVHYSFTGEKLDIGQTFGITDTQFQQEIAQRHTREGYQEFEHHQQHGTYQFERQMLALIRNGDVEQLEQFFVAAANAPKAQEGKLAETPLRKAKNIFIGWATMVGKDAAIPGGLDIEQTYRLIDTYIQECEKLQSEDAIKNLQYNMPMDFARRVAQQKLPKNISREVYGCMQFIGSHINEPIQVEDVVAFLGTSRAYLFQKFRQELGMGIGAYLLQCRLREAKFLLRFTDKSLGEISSYLCFSSQSHFQNQFKKHVGQTPAQFRKQRQA